MLQKAHSFRETHMYGYWEKMMRSGCCVFSRAVYIFGAYLKPSCLSFHWVCFYLFVYLAVTALLRRGRALKEKGDMQLAQKDLHAVCSAGSEHLVQVMLSSSHFCPESQS